MKRFFWLGLACLLLACQPQPAQQKPVVFLIDGKNVYTLTADSATPAALAAQAGLTLRPADRFLLNGQWIPAEMALPVGPTYTLQLRRAVSITLLTPDSQTTFDSTAATVGQALAETGLQLFARDYIAPPPETPLHASLTVEYRPARAYTIRADGVEITVKSSAQTVGQVLASGGMALLGLDQSLPAESDPAPADGRIEIIRVVEAVQVVQKAIPFPVRYEFSTELPLGSENILTPGEPGLSLSMVKIRYENGVEVSRSTESESVVRPPVARVVGRGTQVTVQSLDVSGTQLQYWRAVQMYATSYSPCRSGIAGCSSGTASGLPVKHGVVAMTRDLFNALRGSQVYIPGYGVAVIADVGGGFPDGRLWIDLGYSDDDWQNWSGWVTVYFLAPAPAYIPPQLQ